MSAEPAIAQQPKRSALRVFRDVLVTLVGAFILFASVFGILKVAADSHWVIGCGAMVFYAVAAYLGLSDLGGKWARQAPIHNGVALVLLTAFTAVAVAASASFQLLRVGWAVYEPSPPLDRAFGTLVEYYLWALLDLLPGLNATKLLSFEVPLAPKNWVGGIPPIAFRAFLIFGVLAAAKRWWSTKKGTSADSKASEA